MGVTIKQIAEEVGLSWPAVSQILNRRGRFAADTRKRVLAVAAERGYRPNSAARALREQNSKLIGVLFRNDAANPLTNMAAFEYLLGVSQRFQDADYGTLLIRAGDLAAAGDLEPRVFRERLVDAVIVVGSLPDPLVERVGALSQRVIWLDAPVWAETCCVRRDERGAGRACVEAMAGLGYQSVLFAARSTSRQAHHSHASRLAGARAAARASGIRLRVVDWPEEDRAAEFEVLREMVASGEGVVAATLPVARRIVHGAEALGSVPGHDYGIVCCDDSYETQAGWRSLGRVGFDRYGLGELAAEMLLQLIANPNDPPASRFVRDDWIIGASAWGPLPKAPTAAPRPRRGDASGPG